MQFTKPLDGNAQSSCAWTPRLLEANPTRCSRGLPPLEPRAGTAARSSRWTGTPEAAAPGNPDRWRRTLMPLPVPLLPRTAPRAGTAARGSRRVGDPSAADGRRRETGALRPLRGGENLFFDPSKIAKFILNLSASTFGLWWPMFDRLRFRWVAFLRATR